MIFFMYFTS
jgi:hypothetical protein